MTEQLSTAYHCTTVREKMVVSINGTGPTRYLHGKKNIKVYSYPTPCIKVNSRWSTDQKGKGKIINIIKNNIFYTDIFFKHKPKWKTLINWTSFKFKGEVYQCYCYQSVSHVWLFVTPWTVALQAPLSVGFPRQEYWSALPTPSPGEVYPKIPF